MCIQSVESYTNAFMPQKGECQKLYLIPLTSVIYPKMLTMFVCIAVPERQLTTTATCSKTTDVDLLNYSYLLAPEVDTFE